MSNHLGIPRDVSVKGHSDCYVKNGWEGVRMPPGLIRDAK